MGILAMLLGFTQNSEVFADSKNMTVIDIRTAEEYQNNRSGQAERIMKSLGFKDVENLGSVSQAAKRLNRPCEGKTC